MEHKLYITITPPNYLREWVFYAEKKSIKMDFFFKENFPEANNFSLFSYSDSGSTVFFLAGISEINSKHDLVFKVNNKSIINLITNIRNETVNNITGSVFIFLFVDKFDEEISKVINTALGKGQSDTLSQEIYVIIFTLSKSLAISDVLSSLIQEADVEYFLKTYTDTKLFTLSDKFTSTELLNDPDKQILLETVRPIKIFYDLSKRKHDDVESEDARRNEVIFYNISREEERREEEWRLRKRLEEKRFEELSEAERRNTEREEAPEEERPEKLEGEEARRKEERIKEALEVEWRKKERIEEALREALERPKQVEFRQADRVLSEKYNRRDEERYRKREEIPPEQQAKEYVIETAKEDVNCTVYSPKTVQIGNEFLVQVFAHTEEQENALRELAMQSDEHAQKRIKTLLDKEISRGDTIDMELIMGDLIVESSHQKIVWNGKIKNCQFLVKVPVDFEPKDIIGKVIVSLSTIPIGILRFKVSIVKSAEEISTLETSQSSMKKFKQAFISYSSKDRPEVLKRVQMLNTLKVKYFQDLLTLEAGNEWEKTIYDYLKSSDVVFLMWSKAASESPWVLKEVLYALQLSESNENESHEIIPIIIEGPPPAKPPKELGHLHFNDKFMYFINTVEHYKTNSAEKLKLKKILLVGLAIIVIVALVKFVQWLF